MEDFYMITVYTPNSQDGLKRLDYRMKWEDDFREYLMRLDKVKPVIVCGDMNVAHKEIDLKNPKTNRKTPDLPTRSATSSANCLQAALQTPSATSIPTRKAFTHGGLTASSRVKRMQAGVSTTSSCQTA